VFALTFPGGTAGSELDTSLPGRERPEFRTLEGQLRHPGNVLPGTDTSRRFEKIAILCVGRVFLPLVIEYFQRQWLELIFQWLTEKSQNLRFEGRNHCPIILTRTRFRRL